MKRCGKIYLRWDTDIFHSLVKEIKHFAELNLISANDGIHLKEELLQLLTELERLSVKGQSNNGHEASIYLSNINFEATYSYITKKDFQISLFRVYSINFMDSQNPHICQMQKDWIQSLKRHSATYFWARSTTHVFLERQRRIIVLLYLH